MNYYDIEKIKCNSKNDSINMNEIAIIQMRIQIANLIIDLIGTQIHKIHVNNAFS